MVIGEKVLKEKQITAGSLDELKKEAEAYVSELKIKIECFAKTL
ncbi:hypothetical protein PH505_bb00390 [Pseudoalteromonas distincta]|nr:hypothetical protein PH505_bb00390 [Pseudoalteromonas distincta]